MSAHTRKGATMKSETGTRSKAEMFNVLVTDAVATMYPGAGLRADQAATVETIRAKMDAAGLLGDCAED